MLPASYLIQFRWSAAFLLCTLRLSWMVIMTGMDWILRSSTPVRSGHQSSLTKALCNKRRGGERYWLPRVNISKSLSLSFFFMYVFICPSFLSLSPSIARSLSDLPPSASTYAPSIPHPLSIHPSNHLFIADLFIPYSFQFRDGPRCDQSARARLLSSFLYTPPEHSSSSSSPQRYLGAGGVTLVQSNAVLIPLDN